MGHFILTVNANYPMFTMVQDVKSYSIVFKSQLCEASFTWEVKEHYFGLLTLLSKKIDVNFPVA